MGDVYLRSVEDFSMITHEQEIEIKNKMIEAKNYQLVKLEMEIERLRSELRLIANGKNYTHTDDKEFRAWAQNRARHAIGEKPGALTIKKGETITCDDYIKKGNQ